ncbi:MAG: hypothetical protein K9K75_06855 [Deltaproteobacteria bacterium]|nr:hypothetical protein [Deltaproteobacteria bacterium]
MRRTEIRLRFEEAYDGYEARRLTQEEAAMLLGVGSKTLAQLYLFASDRHSRESGNPDVLKIF